MQIRETFERIRADRTLTAWNLAVLAVAVLPLIVFFVARAGIQGEEEDMNNQQQYDYNGNPYRMHWWQFWRKSNPYAQYQNNQGEQQKDREGGAPWWCKFSAM